MEMAKQLSFLPLKPGGSAKRGGKLFALFFPPFALLRRTYYFLVGFWTFVLVFLFPKNTKNFPEPNYQKTPFTCSWKGICVKRRRRKRTWGSRRAPTSHLLSLLVLLFPNVPSASQYCAILEVGIKKVHAEQNQSIAAISCFDPDKCKEINKIQNTLSVEPPTTCLKEMPMIEIQNSLIFMSNGNAPLESWRIAESAWIKSSSSSSSSSSQISSTPLSAFSSRDAIGPMWLSSPSVTILAFAPEVNID